MAFLNKAESALLLKSFTGEDLLVALLGISTGGRWSELATLKPAQIVNGRVTFLKIKNAKKRESVQHRLREFLQSAEDG